MSHITIKPDRPIDPPISDCERTCPDEFSHCCPESIECEECGRISCSRLEGDQKQLEWIPDGNSGYYLCCDGFGCDGYNKFCQACEGTFEAHEILTVGDKKVCWQCGIQNYSETNYTKLPFLKQWIIWFVVLKGMGMMNEHKKKQGSLLMKNLRKNYQWN